MLKTFHLVLKHKFVFMLNESIIYAILLHLKLLKIIVYTHEDKMMLSKHAICCLLVSLKSGDLAYAMLL